MTLAAACQAGRRCWAHSEQELSYPLFLGINFVVNADGSSAQTTTVDQRHVAKSEQGDHESRVSNAVTNADTLLFSPAGALTGFQDRHSTQSYLSRSDDACYSRTITAADGLLTSVVDGQGCGHGH